MKNQLCCYYALFWFLIPKSSYQKCTNQKETPVMNRIKIFSIYALLISVLSACSSNRLVQTYVGSTLAKNEIGVLTKPENIKIISVNGRAVKNYLLNRTTVNYGLETGVNVVLFNYESVWGSAKKDADDSPSIKVLSVPTEVIIHAKAGGNYHFTFDEADDVLSAKALAANFNASILDENGVLVANSKTLTKDSMKQAMKESEVNEQGQASNKDELLALKALWKKIGESEKKKFLAWVFQQ